jgi:hypothetical protein
MPPDPGPVYNKCFEEPQGTSGGVLSRAGWPREVVAYSHDGLETERNYPTRDEELLAVMECLGSGVGYVKWTHC